MPSKPREFLLTGDPLKVFEQPNHMRALGTDTDIKVVEASAYNNAINTLKEVFKLNESCEDCKACRNGPGYCYSHFIIKVRLEALGELND